MLGKMKSGSRLVPPALSITGPIEKSTRMAGSCSPQSRDAPAKVTSAFKRSGSNHMSTGATSIISVTKARSHMPGARRTWGTFKGNWHILTMLFPIDSTVLRNNRMTRTADEIVAGNHFAERIASQRSIDVAKPGFGRAE